MVEVRRVRGRQCNPVEFAKIVWPQVTFYKEQREILYSLVHNDETYVAAGNKLGKDFVSGYAVLWFFLTRWPCRIITTSAKDDHLAVLWGEIQWFIHNARIPLDVKHGGPLIINIRELRRVNVDGGLDAISYVKGMVANDQSIAAMGGHHAEPKIPDGLPHTLFVADEASSVPDDYYRVVVPWAKRLLIIGNTWPCNNFFYRGVKGGDVRAAGNGHYYRKVFHIAAADSPNVRLGMAEVAKGLQPSGDILIPGVKDYHEYLSNRALWDEQQQCVSLDARFYEGAGVKMFPLAWLRKANEIADRYRGRKRQAKAIGIDPAEGGDKTSMAAVDEYGLIEMVSRKTPDTSVVTAEAIAFGRKHNVEPMNWVFDRGGGGKQHADRLRDQGYEGVRTVAFGESTIPEVKRMQRVYTPYETRLDEREEKYAYYNRRSEMYHSLRVLIDPSLTPNGFGIPREYQNLESELLPIPLTYDAEGRVKLLPKSKEGADPNETLIGLIGHSPDEADALVLAIHGMQHPYKPKVAGAMFGQSPKVAAPMF